MYGHSMNNDHYAHHPHSSLASPSHSHADTTSPLSRTPLHPHAHGDGYPQTATSTGLRASASMPNSSSHHSQLQHQYHVSHVPPHLPVHSPEYMSAMSSQPSSSAYGYPPTPSWYDLHPRTSDDHHHQQQQQQQQQQDPQRDQLAHPYPYYPSQPYQHLPPGPPVHYLHYDGEVAGQGGYASHKAEPWAGADAPRGGGPDEAGR
jgi:hypothetical protein